MTRNELELIENYLQGKLQGAELADFEQRMKADEAFSSRVAEQKKLMSALNYYGQRSELKGKLNAYHNELKKEEKLKKRPKIIKFFITQYPTIAVAASVAIITVFATLFSIEYLHSIEKKQHAYYKELRRDLDKIKSSQNKIIKEINTTDTKKNLPRSGGTGFAITANGYIVTSYHIVKEADSVLIENSRYKSLKAVVVDTDKAHDLAVLKITDTAFSSLGALPYTFTAYTQLAEKVFILGYPKEDMVYGEGSISSESGYEGDTTAYQISVPVNPGNSGSPLLDNDGTIVGIISGKHIEAEGASFAIKSRYIALLVEALNADSATTIYLPKKANNLKGRTRPQQLKKLQDYVFMIKVFGKE